MMDEAAAHVGVDVMRALGCGRDPVDNIDVDLTHLRKPLAKLVVPSETVRAAGIRSTVTS